MTILRKLFAAALAASLAAGCVASTAVPLSREVWRLQVTVDDAAGPSLMEDRVLREAAALAFRNGAPYFLLTEVAPADATDDAVRAILYGDTRVFLIAPAAPTGREVTATVGVVLILDEEDPRTARAYRTLDHIGG